MSFEADSIHFTYCTLDWPTYYAPDKSERKKNYTRGMKSRSKYNLDALATTDENDEHTNASLNDITAS
jgi:hypothetical protein